MIGAIGGLMYKFTLEFAGTFILLWGLSYEYYANYGGIVLTLISGIAAALAPPKKPVVIDATIENRLL